MVHKNGLEKCVLSMENSNMIINARAESDGETTPESNENGKVMCGVVEGKLR
jgi:hypothetical protein